jgi:hypothetical protein
VAHEGAEIWLFLRLRTIGALELIPGSVADRLRELAFEAAALRMQVEAEVAAVVVLLEAAAVPVILIKGAARRALAGRYPYLDARGTLDVDLLVPADRSAAAEAALLADGYKVAVEPKGEGASRHHHLPPLHKGRVTVELHESTSVRVSSEVAWTRASAGSEVVEWAGLSVRVPSATELAWNAIAHAMEDQIGGFRLKRFLEVAALVSNGAPVDWKVLQARSITLEAFDPAAGVQDGSAVIRAWIAAMLTLVAAEQWPSGVKAADFDLAGLLAWRTAVLQRRRALGRPLTERLLAEGARTFAGMPLEASPPSASRGGRMRRRAAGNASRMACLLWRAVSS